MKQRNVKIFSALIIFAILFPLFLQIPSGIINTQTSSSIKKVSNDIGNLLALSNASIDENFTFPNVTIDKKTPIILQEDIRSWIGIDPILFQDYDNIVNGKPTIGSFDEDRYGGTETDDPAVEFFHNRPYVVDEKYEGHIQTSDGRTLFLKRFTVEWQQMYVTMAQIGTYFTDEKGYLPHYDSVNWTLADIDLIYTHPTWTGIVDEPQEGPDPIEVSIPTYYLTNNYTSMDYEDRISASVEQFKDCSARQFYGRPIIRLIVDSKQLYKYFRNISLDEGVLGFRNQTYVYISDIRPTVNITKGFVHNESKVVIRTLETPTDVGGIRLPKENRDFWGNRIDEYDRRERPDKELERGYLNGIKVISAKGKPGQIEETFYADGWLYTPPEFIDYNQEPEVISLYPNYATPTIYLDKLEDYRNITIRGRTYDSFLLDTYGNIDSVLFTDRVHLRPMSRLYHIYWQIHQEIYTVQYGRLLMSVIDPNIFASDNAEPIIETIAGWEVFNVFAYRTWQADIVVGAYYDWEPENTTATTLGFFDEQLGDTIFLNIPTGAYAGVVGASLAAITGAFEESLTAFQELIDEVLNALTAQGPLFWIIVIIGVVIAIVAIVWVVGRYIGRRRPTEFP